MNKTINIYMLTPIFLMYAFYNSMIFYAFYILCCFTCGICAVCYQFWKWIMNMEIDFVCFTSDSFTTFAFTNPYMMSSVNFLWTNSFHFQNTCNNIWLRNESFAGDFVGVRSICLCHSCSQLAHQVLSSYCIHVNDT